MTTVRIPVYADTKPAENKIRALARFARSGGLRARVRLDTTQANMKLAGVKSKTDNISRRPIRLKVDTKATRGPLDKLKAAFRRPMKLNVDTGRVDSKLNKTRMNVDGRQPSVYQEGLLIN